MKEIYFAGGCFWGVEKYMSLIKGVTKTEVGYANGKTQNPTYEDVCYRDTDHAETVKVTYDENTLPLSTLINLYFDIIDPTLVDQQGPDVGRQYRTGIYCTEEESLKTAKEELDKLKKRYRGEIVVVECKILENYYKAEDAHQKFLTKNPTGYCHIGKSAFKNIEEFNLNL